MMTGNKACPTTTATPARIGLFQPTQRPVHLNNERFATTWGSCRIFGRLGQRHADLFEAILYTAEKQREVDDGGIELMVDPAQVRKILSDDGHSGERIRAWLNELMAAVVDIEKEGVKGHLIDHVRLSEKKRFDPLTDKESRSVWIVRLGLPAVHLLKHDIKIYYDPRPIARLQYGISQAIARHALTHESSNQKTLDGLISAVTGSLPPAALRKAKFRIKKDGAGLLAAGVVVDGESVRLS